MTPAYRIYISAPADSNLSSGQLELKRSVVEAIRKEGFEPQEFFGSGIPKAMAWSFEKAELVMSRCHGAAILAFARWLVYERTPRSAWRTEPVDTSNEERQTAPSFYLPSEYNHFEGALAFTRRLPWLVITDDRVRTGGITLLSEGPASIVQAV